MNTNSLQNIRLIIRRCLTQGFLLVCMPFCDLSAHITYDKDLSALYPPNYPRPDNRPPSEIRSPYINREDFRTKICEMINPVYVEFIEAQRGNDVLKIAYLKGYIESWERIHYELTEFAP